MTQEIKQKDKDIAKAMPKVMDVEEKYTTKELAKKLAGGNDGKHYVKQRLHINREWFPQKVDDLETFVEDDETGGNDTRYWRLDR